MVSPSWIRGFFLDVPSLVSQHPLKSLDSRSRIDIYVALNIIEIVGLEESFACLVNLQVLVFHILERSNVAAGEGIHVMVVKTAADLLQ